MPTCIEEMGFKELDDLDVGWFMKQPEWETAHLLFRLEDAA